MRKLQNYSMKEKLRSSKFKSKSKKEWKSINNK